MSQQAYVSPDSLDFAALTPANARPPSPPRTHDAPLASARPGSNYMPERNDGDRVHGGGDGSDEKSLLAARCVPALTTPRHSRDLRACCLRAISPDHWRQLDSNGTKSTHTKPDPTNFVLVVFAGEVDLSQQRRLRLLSTSIVPMVAAPKPETSIVPKVDAQTAKLFALAE
jgi:hypothetical protein